MFSSNIDNAYIVNIGYKKIKNEVPNSFGLIIPVTKNFNLALGINQSYNKSYELDVTVTTEANPDGDPNVPKFHFFEKTLVYGFDLTGAYAVKSLFSDTDKLSIGTNISFNYLSNNADDFSYLTKFSEPEIGWKIGAVYQNKFEENKYYSLGLFYEKR